MDWRDRALCRDEDADLFFPIGTAGPAKRQTEEAKAVCMRCAVTSDCLNWALDTGQDSGVWGGLDEAERRALKQQTGRRAGARNIPNPFIPMTIADDLAWADQAEELHASGYTWDEVPALLGIGQTTFETRYKKFKDRLVGFEKSVAHGRIKTQ